MGINKLFSMIKIYYFFFILSFCFVSCYGANNHTSDIDTIISRIVVDKISSTVEDTLSYNDNKISELIHTISEEGCWADIDYSSQEAAVWEPRFHLERLTLMAVSLVDRKSIFYNDKFLENKLIDGLKFWVENDPHSSNWWWIKIGEPHRLGLLLNVLKYGNVALDENLSNSLVDRLPNSDPFIYSGANRSDIGIANLYKALYVEMSSGVIEALSAIFSSVEIGGIEAFQDDGCYFTTGSHLYIGGYAEVLLKNTLKFAEYVRGTEFEISEDKTEIMSNFVRGAYAGSIRGHVMAFNCHGRSVSRKDQLHKVSSIPWLKKLQLIDQSHEDEYSDMISRLNQEHPSNYHINSFTRHYYKGDYTIQQTPNYNIAIRTLSARTSRDESDNGENLKGYFICDGSTTIARTGEEYYNIMPLWNWNYIPGTTSPTIEEIPKPYFLQMGNSEFCGGVTDSIHAVIGFKYYDSYKDINTGAHKGYFLFNKEMICLGSNIESDKQTHTTINQAWYNKNGCAYNTDASFYKAYLGVDTVFKQPLYLVHDSIGYYIPAGQSTRLLIDHRNGTWYDINNGFGTEEEVKGDIFQLSLNHDDNDFYEYVVIPHSTIEEVCDYIKNCPIEILSNTEDVQAVYNKRENIYGLIFYNAGSQCIGNVDIRVSSPCIMLLKALECGDFLVYISDPTQSLNNTTIEIESNSEEIINVNVEFPIEKRGSTIMYKIQRQLQSKIQNYESSENIQSKFYFLDGRLSNVKNGSPIIEVKGKDRRLIISK